MVVFHNSFQDGFVVRMVNPASSPVVSVNELPLKLARKCLDVFGTASFDEDANIHTIHTGCDEETVVIAAGKDFGLSRINSGKVGAKKAFRIVWLTKWGKTIFLFLYNGYF